MFQRRVVLAALIVSAMMIGAPADAYRLWMTSDYTGGPLEVGDRITVDVHLDTEGDTGLVYFSVAVVYPPNVIAYVPEESSYNASYALYAPAPSKGDPTWMLPTGPTSPDHPPRWPLANDQVNVDFISASIRPSQSSTSDEVMATLVFEPVGFGSGPIELSFDRAGNIFGVNNVDVKGTIDTGAPVVVNAAAVPGLAPWGLALLAGLIAFAGRRVIPNAGARAALAALALFGAALSVPTTAGPPLDVDSDGVPNTFDNCVTQPNGPLLGTSGCVAQEDGDADGYGNACDADFDDDGIVSLVDHHIVLNAIGASDPVLDINCDGAVGFDDHSRTLDGANKYTPAGPSGLDCAGTIPCTAP